MIFSTQNRASLTPRPFIFICFVLSGFASLLYQIVWMRLALSRFGVIAPVLSTVVSIFMLGLGFGSLLAPRILSTLRQKVAVNTLVTYSLLEFGVGLWALLVPFLFRLGERELLGVGSMTSWGHLCGSATILLVSMLPPCIGMGATLPVMMDYLKESAGGRTTFSFLYMANVIGAFVGTLLTPFVLIEQFGFSTTLRLGSALSVSAALIAYFMRAVRPSRISSPDLAQANPEVARPIPSQEPRLLYGALFLTGFSSMGLEVVWTRAFTPILGTTIYAFSAIVAIYLLATYLGSQYYRARLNGKGIPSLEALVFALIVSGFLPLIAIDPRLGNSTPIALVSLIPFCSVLGCLTPFLVDRVSLGHPARASRAYAVNVAGCTLGPLVASYGLLPTSNTHTSLIILNGLLIGIFWTGGVRRKQNYYGLAIGAFALLTALVLRFGRSIESVLAQSGPAIIRRDSSATVVASGKGFDRELWVNGVGITKLTPLTKMMAHLPVLAHQEGPRNALMICFGMGTTYRSLLAWDLEVTAVELIPSVKEVFSFFFDDADRVLKNPRGRVIIDDGRRFLARTHERFDIITLDPPPPVEAAASGLLYSREFYDQVRTHLAPGGILQQWWPGGEQRILWAVASTLRESFPYVRAYKGLAGVGFHFLASETPFSLPTVSAAIGRMPTAVKNDFLEWGGDWTLTQLVEPVWQEEIPIDRIAPRHEGARIEDDRPFNEYFFIRRAMGRKRGDNYWVR